MIERVKGHGKYSTLSIKTGSEKGCHVKLRPSYEGRTLFEEAKRIRWARGRFPSPEQAYAFKLPGVALLITKTLEGKPSYKQIDVLEPINIIAGILRALNAIKSADAIDFPFAPPEWATEAGAHDNLRQLKTSKTKQRELHPDFTRLSLRELKDIIDEGPDNGSTSLNHGDFCMPNVLLNDDGQLKGIVDLGGMHIGNSQLDLAVMSWTIEANMGPKWANHLLETYGVAGSDQSIQYNRLIYDLGLEQPKSWSWIHAPKLIEQRARLSE